MTTSNLQSLGPKIIEKRGNRGIRDVAQEIGVSPATLNRIENGNVPDLETFRKICLWLKIDPGDMLGFKVERSENDPIAVHFRKDRTTDIETAKALASMILAADRAFAHQEKLRGS